MPTHDIARDAALEITGNFQESFPEANKAVTIPKDEIIELLTQQGAVGLRIYFAIRDPGEPEINAVLCAVDGNGDDIEAYKDNCLACPPICGQGL